MSWRVIAKPPVRFRRTPGLLPLPPPQRGGSLDALRRLLNLPNQDDFVLVVAWLLAALRPHGPYPLLAITGEPGAANDRGPCQMLKALIDPMLRPCAPRRARNASS